MQTAFSKIAQLLVMLHLATGCFWHHGLGRVHACDDLDPARSADVGHCHHGHDASHATPQGEQIHQADCDLDCHTHLFHCIDDRCSIMKSDVFEPDCDSAFSFQFVETRHPSPKAPSRFGNRVERWSAGGNPALGVRAHLMNCVMLT